jgi:hypothetical protein
VLTPKVSSSFVGAVGYAATVSVITPRIAASVQCNGGSHGAIATSLPKINAALNAGFGAVGTISAKLPKVIAAITVLAQATEQQLVMVLNTHNNALSTYQNYPFNSFCSLGGVYYGAGPNGFSQLDVPTATDDAAPVAAGLSFGMLDFKEPKLKRISDAYMTLRTAGNLTLTITVDEGIPVILTMTAQQFATFIQRRIITPKGLVGKSWQFAINNQNGAAFDFGQLGFNTAVSARRIGS